MDRRATLLLAALAALAAVADASQPLVLLLADVLRAVLL